MLATKMEDYNTVINDIVSKIEKTQLTIFENANANVMDLYFYIGKVIDDRVKCGNKFVDELSIELKLKFPNAKV